MKAILALLLLCSTAHAQYVWVDWVACPPGGCCPPQNYYYDNWEPRRNPRVQPDGWETPPVGSPNTPDFNALPTPPPAAPPVEPVKPVEPTPDIAACECGPKWAAIEKQQAEIIKLIGEIKAKPGPPGPAGPAGPPGPKGDTPQVDIPTTPAEVMHYVLVADEGASYWRRVGDTLRRAQETYSQIKVTPPPTFPVGQLPQLVAYSNGKPLGAFKGQHAVENALAFISRGETPKP